MGSRLQKVIEKELVPKGTFPTWLKKSVQYEAITGSVAHGISADTSDMDIMGFCIPRKEIVFPHLAGKLHGFDKYGTFEQWDRHHIKDPEHRVSKTDEYDFTIYSIVKFFKLAMKNSSQLLEALFTPQDCVLHCTPVGGMVRSNRRIFLHKGSFHSFTGYMHAQMSKLNREPVGKRKAVVEKYGFDVKYSACAVRLADMCDQILELGDLDVRRPKDYVKSIRNGEVPLDDIKKWLFEKERHLQRLYTESRLRKTPDKPRIKQLLLDCLESHFGNLEKCEFESPDKFKIQVEQIREFLG